MKKFILLIYLVLYTTCIVSQENETTTYYFIRHAEKVRTDKTNKNPDLSKQGNSRAENWSVVFETIDFDLIYSTNYNRTIQTATPTALKKQLKIQYYNPSNLYDADFKAKTKGKTVLIVGHSNTTPKFVNDILEKRVYEAINDNNNDNLYIVTINGTIKNSTLLKIPHSK
ncbi:Histidine phosphatase superfamily (branch 1) [Lutibacter agarilyticus]|uniref:Histidine phosphatase superfamily (Branch 1) n=1 Tax=Lutibacter agarilyticus TaxID=1109740 RepID=A0A238VHF2_9FLAO|nr:histidine phosphatase family protein [Lutibacter agarilyticus]SNR33666.1 Histidine phosphatase superfamily (branch 1) [Lutibacter agarilyticus]